MEQECLRGCHHQDYRLCYSAKPRGLAGFAEIVKCTAWKTVEHGPPQFCLFLAVNRFCSVPLLPLDLRSVQTILMERN